MTSRSPPQAAAVANKENEEQLFGNLSEDWISQPTASRNVSETWSVHASAVLDPRQKSSNFGTFRVLSNTATPQGLRDVTPQWKNGKPRDLFSKMSLEKLFGNDDKAHMLPTPPVKPTAPLNMGNGSGVLQDVTNTEPTQKEAKELPHSADMNLVDDLDVVSQGNDNARESNDQSSSRGGSAFESESASSSRVIPTGDTHNFTFRPPTPETPKSEVRQGNVNKSPLKLFQNYDTYTTNHLSNMLSGLVESRAKDSPEAQEPASKKIRKTISSPQLTYNATFKRDESRKGSITTSDFVLQAQQIMQGLRQNNLNKSKNNNSPMSKISEAAEGESSRQTPAKDTNQGLRSHFSDWSTNSARSRHLQGEEKGESMNSRGANIEVPSEGSTLNFNSMRNRWEQSFPMKVQNDDSNSRSDRISSVGKTGDSHERLGSKDTARLIEPKENIYPDTMGSMTFDREGYRWIRRGTSDQPPSEDGDDIFDGIEDLKSSSQIEDSHRSFREKPDTGIETREEGNADLHSMSAAQIEESKEEQDLRATLENAYNAKNVNDILTAYATSQKDSLSALGISTQKKPKIPSFQSVESSYSVDSVEPLQNWPSSSISGDPKKVEGYQDRTRRDNLTLGQEQGVQNRNLYSKLNGTQPKKQDVTFSTPLTGHRHGWIDENAKKPSTDRQQTSRVTKVFSLPSPIHREINISNLHTAPLPQSQPSAKKQLQISIDRHEFTMPQTPYAKDILHVGQKHKDFRRQEKVFSDAMDMLVSTLTDWNPFEPAWVNTKTIDLHSRGIETVVKLDSWLPALDDINVADNRLGYLTGIPELVRSLNVASNW